MECDFENDVHYIDSIENEKEIIDQNILTKEKIIGVICKWKQTNNQQKGNIHYGFFCFFFCEKKNEQTKKTGKQNESNNETKNKNENEISLIQIVLPQDVYLFHISAYYQTIG